MADPARGCVQPVPEADTNVSLGVTGHREPCFALEVFLLRVDVFVCARVHNLDVYALHGAVWCQGLLVDVRGDDDEVARRGLDYICNFGAGLR